MDLKRVCFTGDILRPGTNGKSSQWINIYWLEQFFGPSIRQAVSVPLEKVLWLSGFGDFDASVIFHHYGMSPQPENWAQLYYADPTLKAAEYVSSHFDSSVVIGFELSPFIMKCLDMAGIIYVDVTIHPIRYMSDIPLYFSTNNIKIYNALERYRLFDEALYAEGRMLAGVRRRMGYQAPRAHSVALLCLQTAQDRVLIDKNKFVRWESYLDQVLTLRDKFDRILIKPHPLETIQFDLGLLLDTVPSVEVIDKNFYQLIAKGDVDKVVSLSSGTTLEAKFLNVESDYLFRNYYNYIEDLGVIHGAFVPVYGKFVDPDFWRDILESVVKTSGKSGYCSPFIPNRVRHSLNTDWGFSKSGG